MQNTFTNLLEKSMDDLYTTGAFLTVGDSNKANTMTISWGSVGYMWRKPVFMVLVRESRYTKEFLNTGTEFTVSIPGEVDKLKKALKICGSKSGRDVDKEKEADIEFINGKVVQAPVIKDCEKYYECKILLSQEMDLNKLNDQIAETFYKNGEDKHILYFGEIVESY